MTTHIVFPELDEQPATLSRRILTGLLREELGFEGIIFTDSLSMDAIDQRYGLADAAIRCKAAGVDVLEANESLENQLTRFRALVGAVEDGTLDPSLFTATRDRLNRVRLAFGFDTPTPPLPPVDPELCREADEIAARTIVVVGDGQFTSVPRDDRMVVIDFQRLRSSEAEDPFNRGGLVRDGIAARFPQARVATISHHPQGEEVIFASNAARQASTLVALTRDATDFPYQLDILQKVFANLPPGAHVIHVALRGPYDAGLLGQVDSTLLTFGDPAVTLRVLVRVLAGEIFPSGTLPIALPHLSEQLA